MGSSTKQNVDKILAARNKQVQIDALNFEIKQLKQKLERNNIKINNLEIENNKLKEELEKAKEKA